QRQAGACAEPGLPSPGAGIRVPLDPAKGEVTGSNAARHQKTLIVVRNTSIHSGGRRRRGEPGRRPRAPARPAPTNPGPGGNKKPAGLRLRVFPDLERETRLELATSTLARLRSTN